MYKNNSFNRSVEAATHDISNKQAGLLIDSINARALKTSTILAAVFVSWVGDYPHTVTSSNCENSTYTLRLTSYGVYKLYLKTNQGPFPKPILVGELS